MAVCNTQAIIHFSIFMEISLFISQYHPRKYQCLFLNIHGNITVYVSHVCILEPHVFNININKTKHSLFTIEDSERKFSLTFWL